MKINYYWIVGGVALLSFTRAKAHYADVSTFKELTKTSADVVRLKISGYIKDELGMPMSGVSVKVVGTNKAVQTDEKGFYSIDVEPTDTLEFVSVGYKTVSRPVRNRVDMDVTMEPEEGSLNEVAIVGFGKQKKASLVGAQSTIKAEELKLPVGDLTNAIAGRVAGIVAYQRGGAPGTGSELFIRGISTLSSSPRGPLLVVDGIPDRSINNIDPEDVESFTVLKDATAVAVYGTRGANGVILINTKKGKEGKPTVNAEFNQSFNKFTQLPKFVDGPTFMTLYNEGLTMRGGSPIYTQDAIDKSASGADPDLYPNVNWYDVLFKDFGLSNRATVNINGGSQNAAYYLSAGYYSENGMFKRDDIQTYNSNLKQDRFNFTSNLNLKLTKTTKLDFGINGYLINNNRPGYSDGPNDIFNLATTAPPHTIPARYSNGQWPQLSGAGVSPYMALTQSGVVNWITNTVRSNLKLTQDLGVITQGLNAHVLYAYDANTYIYSKRGRTLPTFAATGRNNGNLITTPTSSGTNDLAFETARNADIRNYFEGALNYARKFGKHDIGGLLLFNQSSYTDATNNVNTYGYQAAIPYRQRNLVGRLNYGFNDRYFLEGNFSYSGADNFSPKKRFGFFPSIGAGWIISNETFFEPVKKVINHFKVRYSYGKSGNASLNSPSQRFFYINKIGQEDPDKVFYRFGEDAGSGKVTGYRETLIGSDVSWESAYRQNLGIEMNFLNNNLELLVELYKEKREGILVQNRAIPYNSGFTNENLPYQNLGMTKNKGIDATLTYTKNFTPQNFVSFRGTFNYNINEVLADGNPPWKYPYLDRIGRPIGQRFGYIAQGLFQSQDEVDNAPTQAGDVRVGDIRYKDLNGDGIINEQDVTAIGYGATPRIIYGLNFAFGYRGFDVALFFQGVGQVDFNYSAGYGTQPFSQGATDGNMYTQVTDRWTPSNPNPNAFYPRLSTNQVQTTNYYTSTWWIKRADYIRLKSAELGYNFNPKVFEKFGIKKIRIYTNGTNLFTVSRWKVWDPELGDGRGASYPNITTYNLGLRINFQ